MDIVQNKPVDRSAFAPLRRYMPQLVRWTFVDLILVALVTLVLGGLSLALVRVLPGVAANADSLALNLGAGGVIYLITLVAVFAVIVRRRRGTWHEIGFRRTSPWWALLVVGIFIVQLLSVATANILVQQITGPFTNPQIEKLIDERGFSWLNFVVVFTVGAIIAPVVEELTFRGLLYQWLRKHTGVLLPVLLSGALFSVVHFIPQLFLGLFLVGVILALAFEWSQSLWVTIALHMMQNSLAIIAIYAAQALGIQLAQ
jgi:hypothetical protein